ncbi:MAG: tetratricopeptide repeat protein, partial [Zetaproteobacteria bacterium]
MRKGWGACVAALIFACPVWAQPFADWPKEDQEALLAAEEDYNFGDLEAVIAALEVLARKHPDAPRVWRLLAFAYTEKKAYAKAEKAFTRWRKLVGEAANQDRDAALYEARALEQAGKPDAAAQRLRAWLSEHPDDVDATIALINLDLRQRSWDEAGALAGRLQKHSSPSVKAAGFYFAAFIAAQRGDVPSAKKLAQRAKALDPQGAYAQAAEKLLAALRARTGGYAQASVGLFHTSNVELLPDIVMPRGSKRADNYLLGTLAAGWRSERWEIGYALAAQKYFRRTDFDLLMQTLRAPIHSGAWSIGPVLEHAMLAREFLFFGAGLDLH